MASCVTFPVMTLVCGTPRIKRRTRTLRVPIAMAANNPAVTPCQSVTLSTAELNSITAAKMPSSTVSRPSIRDNAGHKANTALGAHVKTLASVGGHGLRLCSAAVGAGDEGFKMEFL